MGDLGFGGVSLFRVEKGAFLVHTEAVGSWGVGRVGRGVEVGSWSGVGVE